MISMLLWVICALNQENRSVTSSFKGCFSPFLAQCGLGRRGINRQLLFLTLVSCSSGELEDFSKAQCSQALGVTSLFFVSLVRLYVFWEKKVRTGASGCQTAPLSWQELLRGVLCCHRSFWVWFRSRPLLSCGAPSRIFFAEKLGQNLPLFEPAGCNCSVQELCSFPQLLPNDRRFILYITVVCNIQALFRASKILCKGCTVPSNGVQWSLVIIKPLSSPVSFFSHF